MSDPAKTPEEIEDVLASIRRLVSDNSPEVAEGETQSSAPVADDRLVLTPSFRVADPEDPWVPVFSAQAADDTAEATATDHSGWQPDDRLAHFDAVGDADDAEEEPMEPSEADLADLLHLDGVAAEPTEFESETGDDNWPSSGAEAALLTLVARREPVDTAKTDAAELETAEDGAAEDDVATDIHHVAVEEHDVEADVSEADEAAELADADDAHSDEEEQAFAQASVDENETEAHADPEFTPEQETRSQSDVDENLAVEEDVTQEIEPPQPFDAESQETVQEPSVTPVFAGRTGPEDAVEDLGEEPSPFSFPADEDGIMDEETLREIIVDVVREELQGVLGQRITRNVRKMVRREVRLALAAEDLE